MGGLTTRGKNLGAAKPAIIAGLLDGFRAPSNLLKISGRLFDGFVVRDQNFYIEDQGDR